jgi:iron complex outermembrane receptor protein
MKKLPTAPILGAAVAMALGCAAGAAHGAARMLLADLADLSLEQLSNITVTSVSRREERVVAAPASIFVITAEDIRRSGANSIPEALRLAPNLQVARIDASQYGVSARGQNTTTTNKMLVLIDGRTVYTPLYSGVFWDAQDVMLEDVERIEVISGPAATLWGSNGVNGVINITTLSAGRTQGSLFSGTAGDMEKGVAARHGGTLGGDGRYRFYAKYFDRDSHDLASGASLRDDATMAQAGFRMDWERPAGSTTFQGDVYSGDIGNLGGARDVSGMNILGRWQHKLGEDSSLRLQAYYDRTERDQPNVFGEKLDQLDIDFQHISKPIRGHLLVWGGGYRQARDDIRNSATVAFIPAKKTLRWSNVFAQDEIAIANNLSLTLGLKAEDDPYTGYEWLPNARIGWQPATDQLLWSALSRAVRAPSRIDRELFSPAAPPYVALAGGPNFQSEIANVLEIGYRAQVSATASFSVTAFHHRFPNLRNIESSPAGPVIANGVEGRTTGVEGWGTYRVSSAWRLFGGFLVLNQSLKVKPGSCAPAGTWVRAMSSTWRCAM